MYGGGPDALAALRAVSIVSGLPLTIAICFMCASLHRACKVDFGEEDIMRSTRFITGLFDWTEAFSPNMPRMPKGIELPTPGARLSSFFLSLFAPFFTLHDMNAKLWPQGIQAAVTSASVAVLFVAWIACMVGGVGDYNASYVGWVSYTFMTGIIAYVRFKARQSYKVYGFWLEDAFACLTMWPWVCSQLSLQANYVSGQPPVDVNEEPNASLHRRFKEDPLAWRKTKDSNVVRRQPIDGQMVQEVKRTPVPMHPVVQPALYNPVYPGGPVIPQHSL